MDEPLKRLSLSDYIRQYRREQPLEVVHYVPHLQTPMSVKREIAAQNIYNAFVGYQHDSDRNSGETYFRLPYLKLDEANFVKEARLPDVCFINIERWKHYITGKPEWQNNPLLITPDIVVKAMSPDDSKPAVHEWIHLCFEDGAQSIWYADWKRKQVDIYTQNEHETYRENDAITGLHFIPGFTWGVTSLLEGV